MAQSGSTTQLTATAADRLVTRLVRLSTTSRTGSANTTLAWRRSARKPPPLVRSISVTKGANRRAAARRSNEEIYIGTLDPHRMIDLEKLEGLRAIGVTRSCVGRSALADCTSLGKVLLATSDPDWLEEVLKRTPES